MSGGLGIVLPCVHHKDLPVLVAPEPVQIRQDAHHRVALTAADEILQGDSQRIRRLHHVKYLVLHVLEGDRLLLVLAHLLLNGPEEVVERKDGKITIMAHVQNSEQILKSLRLLLVLHGEDKVQVGLVVHLALVGETLLEDAFHKDGGEGARTVAQELGLAQHAVVVGVQVQVLPVHPERE